MQTMTINGVTAPVITSKTFLVDLGPLPLEVRVTWLADFRIALNAYGAEKCGGLPIPVEMLAQGASGRTVLRVWAPAPDQAVYAAEQILDAGPRVTPL